MQRLEHWLFPPTCVLTGEKTQTFDLKPEFLQTWRISVETCPICAEPSPETLICGRCLRHPPAFVRSQVGFEFRDQLRDLIHQYKYQQQLYLSRLLADCWLERLDAHNIEAIIPVPLHISRLRQRGYNQALELARMLSKKLNIPIIHALSRSKATVSQTHLNAKQRTQNLKRAFQADSIKLQNITRIALLDDVITTGATMQQAAKTLIKAQPGLVIEAWALAKTPH